MVNFTVSMGIGSWTTAIILKLMGLDSSGTWVAVTMFTAMALLAVLHRYLGEE